jgi:Uma2 family endonuclease
MSQTATRITADQYYEITVEGDRKQLVDGVIVVTEPRPIHGLLQFRLANALGRWIEDGDGRGLAVLPTDVVMDEYNVYGPDLLWIAEKHRPADLRKRLARVPDLCVEIRSPSNWRYDIGAKKRVYESGGLPELWLSTTCRRRCSRSVAPRRTSTASTSRWSSAEATRSPRRCCLASRSRSTSCSKRRLAQALSVSRRGL